MSEPRIADVNYSPQDGRVRVDVTGLPSACLAAAEEIFNAILTYGRWEYTTIDGKRIHGGALPQDFNLKIVATRMS
jgi:hypothetical protein